MLFKKKIRYILKQLKYFLIIKKKYFIELRAKMDYLKKSKEKKDEEGFV